jgi:outer membrane receptor protein involved in Fe transport
VRYDNIHAQLWHVARRDRLPLCFDQGENPCSNAQIGQTSIGAYVEEDLRIAPWIRVVAGARADLFEFNVDDLKHSAVPSPTPTTGLAQKSIVNPKLQIVLRPTPIWDIYLDGGGGFHSNDARGVIAAHGSGALPRAWGAELGTRLRLFGKLDLGAALWQLHLQSEQVFSADDASTAPSDPTQRYGVDLEARYAIFPWLWADGDLSLATARYTQDRGNGNAVALAPTRTASLGLNLLHPNGYRGRIGLRHVGDRPATQDRSLTAQGYTVFDLSLAYRYKFLEVGLVIENLFNTSWREAQFANESQLRLPPYLESAPVMDIHFTPGSPLSVRGTVAVYF